MKSVWYFYKRENVAQSQPLRRVHRQIQGTVHSLFPFCLLFFVCVLNDSDNI